MNMQDEFRGKEEVNKYLAKLRADRLSRRTIEKDAVYLKTSLKYIDKEPSDITIEDVERWQYEMVVNRKYEENTIYQSILILRKFLRFLGKSDITGQIKIPKRRKTPPPEKEIWLLPDEQKMMAKKSKEMGTRDHAMIKVFLSSGVRASELRNIDISDINFDEQTIHIRHGKGDKSRIVCFDRETKNALIEYLKERKIPTDGSDALFVSIYGNRLSYKQILDRVKECTVLAGIDKTITPHKLRHTFVTTVIERTKDIPLAQKLADHVDIQTTMRYHHSTQEQVVAKYQEYFDEPKAVKEREIEQLSPEEIIRTLDTKYIKGEIPLEVYNRLLNKYGGRVEGQKFGVKSHEYDVAYC